MLLRFLETSFFFCRITVETNMDDGYDGYKKSIGSLTES